MEKIEKKLLKISMAASCTLSLLMPNVAMAQENDQTTEAVQAEIYPKPQKMEYLSTEGMKLEGTVNLVVHGEQNEATVTKVKELLTAENISFVEADEVDDSQATILITTDESHCDDCAAPANADATVLEEEQGYILSASNDENTKGEVSIVGADEDGAYYGVMTLTQMMEQGNEDGTFAEAVISDYPDVKLRGFVEGFYGYPWSFEDRLSLMSESSKFKMNTYIYAPKDDPYHKDQWRDLYPDDKAEELRQLAEEGKKDNMSFCWSVHPGYGFDYSTDDDYNALIRKFEQLYDLGVRQFGISYDDLSGSYSGQDHADLINRVNREFVQKKGDVKPLIVVGTRYCNGWGPDMQTYFKPFFSSLDDDIVVMWTGANTMSAITKEAYEWPKTQTGVNKNLAAWWNYPVNDYCDGNLMMSPLENLDNDVDNLSGFFLNPMSQAEASKVAIFSGADYSWNIGDFERTSSWKRAIAELVPEANEAFERFADNISYIKDGFEFDESRYLVDDITNFQTALQNNSGVKEAAEVLKADFTQMKEDVTTLRSINNENLLEEITMHLNAYEAVAEAGIASMDAFIAAEDGIIDDCLSNITQTEIKLDESETYQIESLETNGTKMNVVKVGEKRIKPLLRDSISQIKDLLMDTVFPQNDPAVIGTMAGADSVKVTAEQGNYSISDVSGTLNAGESIGIRLPKAMKVGSVTTEIGAAEGLKLQYSVNGYEWTDAEALSGEINATATYVRILNDSDAAVELDLTSMLIKPVYNVGVMKAETDLGTYEGTMANTIDGNIHTKFYSSAGATVGSYARVDLGKEIPLHDVAINFAGNPKGLQEGVDGFFTTKLEISTDGVTWIEIGKPINYLDYTDKTIDGQQVFAAEFNAEGQMARYIRFSATEASDNWVQIFEITFNETEGMLGDDTIDVASSTFTDGTLSNLYDRDLTTAFAPTTVKDGDTLNYAMTTITDVGNLMIMQDAEAISNATVSVKNVDGTWKDVGALDKEVTNLAINDTITEVKLTFNGSDPAPVIYEIIAQEQSDEPGDEEIASEASVQALKNMVEKANALGSDDAALQAAITAAQNVIDKEAPTVTEVVTALLDLSEAMQALNTEETVDALREDVQESIDFINANILNNEEGLRPAQVQALKDAVAKAQDVVNDPEATADELKEANKAMTKAANELWEIVTKAELEALIESANGYLDGDYTEESMNALTSAIDAAKAVAANDDATTAEVTQAITDLANAIAGLEEITLDTSALAHEIEIVTEMVANLDDYVPSTVEGLADKLAAAQNVLDTATTQDAIDEATAALREARLNARTLADKSALYEALSLYSGYSENDYTPATWAAFYTAYTNAADIYNDKEAAQEEVNAATEALNTAAKALVKAPQTQKPSADAQVTQKPSANADTTNTAAAVQTGLFAGVLAAAAGALLTIRRRMNRE